jgi:hypothetical protein
MTLSESQQVHQWAYGTFGELELGNRQRTRRVVAVAKALAARAAGTVTEVFADSGEREGAYRLLSNEAVSAEQLLQGVWEATGRQCAEHSKVYVAVDGSTLSLTDRTGGRGLGCVGAWKDYGRGLQVVTALALDAQGVALGICAQRWWARTERSPHRHHDRRKLHEKETGFAVAAIQQAAAHLRQEAPDTYPIFVLDRGFDSRSVLQAVRTEQVGLIVRAKYDRRLSSNRDAPTRHLLDTLQSQPVRGHYSIAVPARDGRPARVARMRVQAARVTLALPVSRRRHDPLEINAVLAREVGGPAGAGLCWMLFTTERIDGLAQVCAVVKAYSLRWRIEEMHRVWKRGGCNVEDTQLRSREAILKWATLHCAVAARSIRLAQLARTHPELPAVEEFSPTEIDAAIVLRRKRTKLKLGDRPSLAEVVRLIADIGGYTGKSSGGPPGPTVIARGLERLAMATEVLTALDYKK